MSGLYKKFKQALLEKQVSFVSDTIKICLVDAAQYTVNLNTHEFLSDIPAGARIATSEALGSKTTTDGVFDCADLSITGVSGPSIEAAVFFFDTGNPATSRLISYHDGGLGLPLTVSGGAVNIQVHASGVFAL